jgi:hypothetical protein
MSVISVSYNSLDISSNGKVPDAFDVVVATGIAGTVVENREGRVVLRANSPIVWAIAQQGRQGDDSFTVYLDDETVLVVGQQVTFDIRAHGEFAIATNVQS